MFGNTLKQDLDAANASIADLTAKLTASEQAKVNSDRAAEDSKTVADANAAKAAEEAGKVKQLGDALETEKAARVEAEQKFAKLEKDFDSKVAAEVARQLAASGHEPLPIKGQETPASKPAPAAGVTGLARVLAAFKAQAQPN